MMKSEQFGKITWTPEEIAEHERGQRGPRFTGLSHISIPVRDLEQSLRFYEEVLGGRRILRLETFAEVIVAGTVIGLSATGGTPNAPESEFPHIAFFIESDQFAPMVAWLEEHGVSTHPVWTRNAVEGLMYFKDPSGNLLEIYCRRYDDAGTVQRAPVIHDVVELRTLNYAWTPPG